LGFDIDGVVADTMTLFLDIARDEFGIDGLRYEDITSYDLTQCIDIEPEVIDAIVARILEGNHRAALRPLEDAPRVLKRIGQSSGTLLMVTARPFVGPMWEWLPRAIGVDPERIDVIATGSFEAKAEALRARNMTHFVEDRLDTCFHLDGAGVIPILFRQPWNRKQHPFLEVGSWRELEALIAY
jgi:uncharacterized HAD superfamily protein